MTNSPNRLLLKGIEEEVYTGTDGGQTVGIADQVDQAVTGFHTEPDRRNPEFSHPPLRSYEDIGSTVVQTRNRFRRQLRDLGDYTLLPGSTMSLGDSSVFLISDPDNEYYQHIRDAYGTRVVTTSTHINVGLDDAETIVRASRLLRAEACLFLALTAASPFLDGDATGHHSTRWKTFPQTPNDAPLFASPETYRAYVHDAMADGRMQNHRHLWISARPNGLSAPDDLNRVEVRICDHICNPKTLLAITALLEARVHQIVSDPTLDPLLASEFPSSTRSEDLRQLVLENESAVAEHSLEATVRHWRDGRLLPVREWLESYYAEALATARKHGFQRYLKPLRQVIDEGNLAMKWLAQFKAEVPIPAIMERSITRMRESEVRYLEETQAHEATSWNHQVPIN